MTLWAITGASGFIGGALARNLSAEGIAVRVLAHSARVTGFDSVQGDIRDREAVDRLVGGASVVVHLAARAHSPGSDPRAIEEMVSVNVDGTRTVVECIAAQRERPLLVFISSASVYGLHRGPAGESAALAPATPYARSKVDAEEVVRSGGIPFVILRPSAVFGAGAPGNLSRLARVVKRGIVPEIGGGRQRKSVVPVENVVAAIRAVVRDRAAAEGETFNVAGEALTLHEVAESIAQGSGRRPFYFPLPLSAAHFFAAAGDVILGATWPNAPSLKRFLASYVADSVIDDSRLSSLPSYEPPVGARSALASLGRG